MSLFVSLRTLVRATSAIQRECTLLKQVCARSHLEGGPTSFGSRTFVAPSLSKGVRYSSNHEETQDALSSSDSSWSLSSLSLLLLSSFDESLL